MCGYKRNDCHILVFRGGGGETEADGAQKGIWVEGIWMDGWRCLFQVCI